MPILTAAAVAKFRPDPKGRKREISDAGCRGLRLCVFPSGARSWIMRLRRPDGRTAKLTLGPVDTGRESAAEPVIGAPLTLAAARKIATEVHRQRALGKDPVADHLAAKRARRVHVEHENTFAACARRYIAEYASVRTRRWHTTARMLGVDPDGSIIPKGLSDRWGNRPVSDIGGNDVHAVVQEALKRGVPGLKRRREGETAGMAILMHSTLSKLFAWLVAKRVVDTNPATGVARPDINDPRDRVLTDDDIRSFWRACDEIKAPFGDIFKLMLITGARRNEVAHMRRNELNGATWDLPGTRTKNRRAHMVPLTPMAREIIAKYTGDEYVFSATPVKAFSAAKRRLDALMPGVAPWRLHDLRRTAVTGMARAGADLHVIERAINHTSGSFGGIVGVYQKHHFAEEVRVALEAWERLLIDIIEPSNVVALRR